jgi:hypothetical protein
MTTKQSKKAIVCHVIKLEKGGIYLGVDTFAQSGYQSGSASAAVLLVSLVCPLPSAAFIR